jgi:hypothetical protein
MKTLILAGAALATLASPLAAQTTIIERRPVIEAAPPAVDEPMDDVEDSTGAVDISPDQDVVIRRRIIEERAAPVIEIPRGQVVVGSAVPRDVPLRPMTNFGSTRLAHLAYFVSPDAKIVVVEPQTRRVVRIIDQQPQ